MSGWDANADLEIAIRRQKGLVSVVGDCGGRRHAIVLYGQRSRQLPARRLRAGGGPVDHQFNALVAARTVQ
jgi:hypothetical protein